MVAIFRSKRWIKAAELRDWARRLIGDPQSEPCRHAAGARRGNWEQDRAKLIDLDPINDDGRGRCEEAARARERGEEEAAEEKRTAPRRAADLAIPNGAVAALYMEITYAG